MPHKKVHAMILNIPGNTLGRMQQHWVCESQFNLQKAELILYFQVIKLAFLQN